jgi:hypothetical protein
VIWDSVTDFLLNTGQLAPEAAAMARLVSALEAERIPLAVAVAECDGEPQDTEYAVGLFLDDEDEVPDCAETCGGYDADACADCDHRVESFDVGDEW